MYRDAISKLIRRQDLTGAEASGVMAEIMEGSLTPAQMGALLAALAQKGETGEELAGFARVLREKALRVEVQGNLLDTCGTGGSGLATHNTSTMVAFVLAEAGVRVAKHGNRASTGRCGSMDVLEELGVPIDLSPEVVKRTIEELGVGFMFAPRFHPAMKHVGPVRKELGVRTSFNFLGPLANPAGTRYQLLGVCDRERAPLMIEALLRLGSERVMVVCGEDGLDEITLTGFTMVWELEAGAIHAHRISPEDVGVTPVDLRALAGGDRAENARVFLEVLGGEREDAIRDHVAINAAAALVVMGAAESLRDGFGKALAILESGAARDRFERYRALASEEMGSR
jgi:anthranilate phosphoribosyltransferase